MTAERVRGARPGSAALHLFFLLAALATSLAGCSRSGDAPAKPAARTVHFYSWSDYIDPQVVTDFQTETGIHVVHDTYDSTEMLETKLLTGRTGYDVVVVGGNALETVALGVFAPLDRTRLPNWRNLDAGMMARQARHDPENLHVAGYLWGTTGVGYNVKRVRELLPDAPTDSWRLVFDPDVASKLAPCGISIFDARSEVIAAALAYLGHNPNSAVPEEMQAVEQVLMELRPSVRKIDVFGQIGDLLSGEICVMLTPGTTVHLARARAAEEGVDRQFRYYIPKEGTISWFDGLAIPADAPHLAEAHAFIDYLMRPAVAAANANYVGGATMNRAAMPLLLESMRADPAFYPPPEVIAQLTPMLPDTQEQTRVETRIWTRFKTGQ